MKPRARLACVKPNKRYLASIDLYARLMIRNNMSDGLVSARKYLNDGIDLRWSLAWSRLRGRLHDSSLFN